MWRVSETLRGMLASENILLMSHTIPKAGSSYITPISNQPTNQPDPITLSADVRSSNYATTPVECCSDARTSFLTLYDFWTLRTRACVLRLRRVCARAHVCMSVCMSHDVTVCVLCVCPHTFVFVEYLQMCL